MKIVKIEPKDVWITIDLSLSELKKILSALDHAEIKYDHKKDIKISEAATYLINDFYPAIKEVVDDLEEN